MARIASTHPTDRELEILQFLWEAGPSSLSEVREGLSRGRPVAATTVASMLKIMSDKGQVERTPETKWRAIVSRRNAGKGMLDRLLNVVFDGSAQRLVAHVVESHPLSDEEIQELRKLLEEQPRRSSGPASTGQKVPKPRR